MNLIRRPIARLCLIAVVVLAWATGARAAGSWTGALRNGDGTPVGEATIRLRLPDGSRDYTARTEVAVDLC